MVADELEGRPIFVTTHDSGACVASALGRELQVGDDRLQPTFLNTNFWAPEPLPV